MDLLPGPGGTNRVHEFRITPTGPGPTSDLAHGLFVDSNQHDATAHRALIDVVADNPHPIFRELAGTHRFRILKYAPAERDMADSLRK